MTKTRKHWLIGVLLVAVTFLTGIAWAEVPLTPQETDWLKAHRVIRIGVDTAYPPFEFVDKEGNYQGITPEYLKLIGERLGIEFKVVPGLTWKQVLEGTKNRTVDMVPALNDTEERREFLSFTRPYLSYPYVIIMRNDSPSISGHADLAGKSMAIPEGFSDIEEVGKKFPSIKIVEVKNLLEALTAVATGKADATQGNLAVLSYLIQKNYLANLKVAAPSATKSTKLALGVRKDWPEFVPMLEKALASITEDERQTIRSKWTSSMEQDAPPVDLTQQERRWLEKQGGFILGVDPSTLSLILKIGGGALALIIMLLVISLLVKRFGAGDSTTLYESRELKGLGMMLIGLFLTIVVLSAWFTVKNSEQRMRKDLGESLSTVLESTHEALQVWVEGKKNYLLLASEDANIRILVEKLLSVPRNREDLLKSWELNALRNFLSVGMAKTRDIGYFIIARDGTSIASMNDAGVGIINLIPKQKKSLLDRAFLGDAVLIPPIITSLALKTGDSTATPGAPTMFFAAPIYNLAKTKVIAVFALQIDPSRNFTRIIQLGRIGLSGETYAFDREGRLITESRFDSHLVKAGLLAEGEKGILNIHIRDPGGNLLEGHPLPSDVEKQPLTVMATDATAGRRGINVGGYRDYRGVPVMGAWMWDKRLSIGMTTEIDVDEALNSFFSIRNTVVIVLGITVLMALILVGLSAWIGQSANRSLRKARDQLEINVQERTLDLQESEEIAKAILNTTFQLQGLLKVDGTLIDANAAAMSMVDASKESLVGVPFWECPWWTHDPDLQARIREAVKQAARGEHVQFIATHVTSNGSIHTIDFGMTPFRDKDGNVALLVPEGHDVTELKQAEEELRKARDTAEEATKAKATFLATMSHEIRTPMNGIVGMVDLLQQSNLTDDQRQMVDTARDSAQSLLTIINDILDFSKIEAGKLDLEEIPISVCNVVESTGEVLAVSARNKDIGLNVYVDPDIPDALIGDPVRLRQIFFNFASNAIKFTETGKVLIRADKVPSRAKKKVTVRFQVIDQGIGIPKEDQENLFQAFSQVEASTTRRFGGTGLGLSICQRLIEMMNGEIGVESVPGEGSTFSATITFPVAEEHTIKSDGHDLKGLNVLLVQRDDVMRELIPRYLEHWKATVTTTAEIDMTKPMALDAAKKKAPFDVICLGSGWPLDKQVDVVRSLQAEKKLSSTGYIIACRSRVKADRGEIDNTVFLDANPRRRADFIRGVAVAAGRASPEVDHDESEITLDVAMPPTVAEAEAMGQLILLAEDNLTNQDVISRQLTMLGYALEIANDGKEALELLDSKSFAILLTDCHMPNMDGYELAETIRKSEQVGDHRLPIVAITASVMKEEVDRCMATGMDDCLAKPLEMKTLKEMLNKLMPAPSGDTKPKPKAKKDLAADGRADKLEAKGVGDGANHAIDPTVLKKLFGDDEATFKEILKDFVEPATTDAGEIEACFADRSIDGVAKAAHKLKSSARSVGANELADLCQTLETAGKAKDWVEINKAAPRLPSTIKKVAEYIHNL